MANGAVAKHFFKKHPRASCWKIPCKIKDDETKPYELVYVSLYGITTVDELEQQLFFEINSRYKHKIVQIGGLVAGKVANFFNMDVDAKDLISVIGGIPPNKILVFDDLERLEVF